MICACLKATPKTTAPNVSISVRVVDSCLCQSLTNWGTASITWWPVLVKAVHPGKGSVASFGRVPLPRREIKLETKSALQIFAALLPNMFTPSRTDIVEKYIFQVSQVKKRVC